MKNKKRNIISFRTKTEVILIAALFIGIAVSSGLGTVTMTDKTTTTDDSGLVINWEKGWISAPNGSFLNWFDVGSSLNITGTNMTVDTEYDFLGQYNWDNAEVIHYAETSTYIIFKDGSTTYCKSGDNGTVMFSDSDDVVVIQYALDQFNDDRGGSVKLKSHRYIINNTIYINYSGVDFSMESMWRGNSTVPSEGTGLFLADNINKDMLMITGRKCHVHDLYMYGNKDNNINSDGIETVHDTALDLHLTDIYIMYFDEHGIHWRGGAGFADGVYCEYNDRNGFYIRGDRNVFTGCGSWADAETGFYITEDSNKFIGCTAADSGQNGFVIQDHDSYGTIVNGCTVQRAGEHGIWIYGGINNIISNCVIENPSNDNDNGYDGIYIGTLAAEHSTYNSIIGNRIYNDIANDQKYCIEEADSNQDYNHIMGNTVTDGQTGQILINGANTICEYNPGYNYNSLQDDYIWNSNGKYWSATGANIQVALDDLNTTSGAGQDNKANGTVWVPHGVYRPTETITLWENTSLICNNALFLPSMDDDVFILHPRSTLKEVLIDIGEASTFSNSSAFVHFVNPTWMNSGLEGFDYQRNRLVQDVAFKDSTLGQRGVGVLLYPADMGASFNDMAWNRVENVKAHFINCTIRLINDDAQNYVNFNTFNNIWGGGCAYHIWLTASANEVSLNMFRGIKYEAEAIDNEHYPIFLQGNCDWNQFDDIGVMDWVGQGDTTDYIFLDDNSVLGMSNNQFSGSTLDMLYITDGSIYGNNTFIGRNLTVKAINVATGAANRGFNPGWSDITGIPFYFGTAGNPYTYFYGDVSGTAKYGSFRIDTVGNFDFITQAGDIQFTPSTEIVEIDDILKLLPRTTDPSPLEDGMIWYNTTVDLFYGRAGGATYTFNMTAV